MWKSLFTPARFKDQKLAKISILFLLLSSAALLLAAPNYMPADYSWVSQTTSESAAQTIPYAWIARLGFLTFGYAVMWLAMFRRREWARSVFWLHLAFGLLMTATAAFSHHPWEPSVQFDPIEDFLHSVTATLMGFAFAFGVLFRMMQRLWQQKPPQPIDIVAVTAATLIPPLMFWLPQYAGILQRMMFLSAYIWFGFETIKLR